MGVNGYRTVNCQEPQFTTVQSTKVEYAAVSLYEMHFEPSQAHRKHTRMHEKEGTQTCVNLHTSGMQKL